MKPTDWSKLFNNGPEPATYVSDYSLAETILRLQGSGEAAELHHPFREGVRTQIVGTSVHLERRRILGGSRHPPRFVGTLRQEEAQVFLTGEYQEAWWQRFQAKLGLGFLVCWELMALATLPHNPKMWPGFLIGSGMLVAQTASIGWNKKVFCEDVAWLGWTITQTIRRSEHRDEIMPESTIQT